MNVSFGILNVNKLSILVTVFSFKVAINAAQQLQSRFLICNRDLIRSLWFCFSSNWRFKIVPCFKRPSNNSGLILRDFKRAKIHAIQIKNLIFFIFKSLKENSALVFRIWVVFNIFFTALQLSQQIVCWKLAQNS